MLTSSAALRRGLLFALAIGGLAIDGPAHSQEPTPAPAGGSAASGGVSPAAASTTPKLAELEQQLAGLQTRADEWAAKAAEYDLDRREAPARLEAIEQEIARLQGREGVDVPENATLELLEAQLVNEEQDLTLVRQEAAGLDGEAAHRAERRKRIPELLASAKERLKALEQEAAAPAGADAALARAYEKLGQARRAALESEIAAYQNELASYDARGQLLVLRLDRARLLVARHEARVEALHAAAKARQQIAAEREAEQALQSLEEATAADSAVVGTVRQLAEENARLARLRTGGDGLLEKIDDVSQKLKNAEELVAKVDSDFADVARKVEAAGLTDSVGMVLRRQRSEAPEVGKYRRFIRMRQELISSVQIRQLELREERRDLADLDTSVERAMARMDPSVSAADRARIQALLRQLLETKRRYIGALIDDYETYFQKLVDFDARQQELIQKTEMLIRYIDERILWIPSGAAVQPQLLADGGDALRWFLGARYWGQLGRALRDVSRASPLLNLAVILAVALSVPLARRVRPRLRGLGERARSPACAQYRPTAEAFALSLLLVPWMPALLGYLGWRLGLSPDATQFTRCFAHGMLAAALVWVTLRLPRQILRGVGEAHFDWPAGAVRDLRRHLSWLAVVAVPAVFLIYVFELRGEDLWKESIGRLSFLVAMGAATAFTHLTLRERGGALSEILRGSVAIWSRPWVRRVGCFAALAVPLLLAAAAVRGYYWTALHLAARHHVMLEFLFLLLVAFRLSARWSLVASRQAAFEQAREQREALVARRAQQALGEPAGEAPGPPRPEVDPAAVKVQTSRLLSTTNLFVLILGTWMIWADVLPAAGILREVELWTTTETVTVAITDADGQERFASEERVVPVTLTNLLLALLIGSMALVMVRNLPGLLEVALLRRLGIAAGERYAYATIIKYGLTIAGVVFAFSAIGVGWSNLQWLIAAIGLGLGFGLQEIFANFISGLIILFERPIRVGDTVTVGEISGTVTKIRIRATWITGFDRKELVVPNKEFVTGRLVNWSLSDSVLRIEVPVGIAYGSDTDKAIDVLHRVARENEHVLREPEPQVLFLGFGDSSLSFELRVFSPDVAHLITIRHEIHMAIDKAFREAGIEIAFPQRDLHLRSAPESWRPVELPPVR